MKKKRELKKGKRKIKRKKRNEKIIILRKRRREGVRTSKKRESEQASSTRIKGSITGTPPSHGFSPRQIMDIWKAEPLLTIHVALLKKDNKKSYARGSRQGNIEA